MTTYFSGIVDEHDRVWLGGYPGALRDVLGVTVEEFVPLLPEESALLASGARAAHWSERIARVGADVEVLDTYAAGELAGMPAVTHRRVGTGSATYVSADLGREGTRALLERLAGEIDALAADPLAAGGRLEVIVRGDEATRHVFLVNRTDEEVVVDAGDGLRVAPRGVPEWAGRPLRVRVSRGEDALTVRAGVDGEPLRLVRVAPFRGDLDAQAGPMVCAPTRAGLEVVFTEWLHIDADASLH